jgi:hypothetical protein
VQTVFPHGKSLIDTMTRLTSVSTYDVELSQIDVVPLDVESCSLPRIRGEIVRHLLETLIDALETDPNTPNLTYLLLGFDMRDIQNSSFNVAGKC